MISALVDTNVFMDVLGPASPARTWSVVQLARLADRGRVLINQIIYSELAARVPLSAVDKALETARVSRDHLSYEAAWRAGKTHALYRRAGGLRERTLPDFLIGAQALLGGHALLTRDPKRYRTYFPELIIISPDTHP
jgi:predicted nucleic acid-binding protein